MKIKLDLTIEEIDKLIELSYFEDVHGTEQNSQSSVMKSLANKIQAINVKFKDVKFKNVLPGEYFYFEDEKYYKLADVIEGSFNAVCIDTLFKIDENARVYPKNPYPSW